MKEPFVDWFEAADDAAARAAWEIERKASGVPATATVVFTECEPSTHKPIEPKSNPVKTRPEVNEYTGECAACGYEYRNARPPTYHLQVDGHDSSPNGCPEDCAACAEEAKGVLCICDDCAEDAHRTFGFRPDSDMLDRQTFEKLAAYAHRARVESWVETNVTTLEQVRAFFDDLSAFVNWHPDGDFADYVQLGQDKGQHVRTFDDETAGVLNARMQEAFSVCQRARKVDVYGLALASAERAGWAPKDEQLPESVSDDGSIAVDDDAGVVAARKVAEQSAKYRVQRDALLIACRDLVGWFNHPALRVKMCDGGRGNLGEQAEYHRVKNQADKAIREAL